MAATQRIGVIKEVNKLLSRFFGQVSNRFLSRLNRHESVIELKQQRNFSMLTSWVNNSNKHANNNPRLSEKITKKLLNVFGQLADIKRIYQMYK